MASTSTSGGGALAADDFVPCHTRRWTAEKQESGPAQLYARTLYATKPACVAEAGVLGLSGAAAVSAAAVSGSRSAALVMRDGDFVLLESPQGVSLQQIGVGKKYRVKKQMTELSAMVGQPYGTSFEPEGKGWVKVSDADAAAAAAAAAEAAEEGSGDDEPDATAAAAAPAAPAAAAAASAAAGGSALSGPLTHARSDTLFNDPTFLPARNNSELFDRNATNQSLTQQQIEELKKKGFKGEALIKIIAQQSRTFESKTEFSQEKYLKKKKKKFGTGVRTLRPTAQLLVEYYFTTLPRKIDFLRADSLAVLLTAANVRAGANTIVLDTCNGLVLAAVAERQFGVGVILNLHDAQSPNIEMCQKLNLPPAATHNIVHVRISALAAWLAAPPQPPQPWGTDDAAMADDEPASGAAAGGKRKRGGGDAPKPKASGISFAAAPAVPAPAPAPAAAAAAPTASSSSASSAVATASRKRGAEEKAKHRATKHAAAVAAYNVLPRAGTGGCGFDSVVLASRFEAEPILRALTAQGMIAGSAAIGMYAHRPEPLQRVVAKWKARDGAPADADADAGTGDADADADADADSERSAKRSKPADSPSAAAAAAAVAAGASASTSASSAAASAAGSTAASTAATGSLAHVSLAECWYREQQVLPNRTHPLMQMSATGGYVLSGLLSPAGAVAGGVAAAAAAAAAASL